MQTIERCWSNTGGERRCDGALYTVGLILTGHRRILLSFYVIAEWNTLAAAFRIPQSKTDGKTDLVTLSVSLGIYRISCYITASGQISLIEDRNLSVKGMLFFLTTDYCMATLCAKIKREKAPQSPKHPIKMF